MKNKRNRFFYCEILLFCFCIVFVILTGCTSTSSSQDRSTSSNHQIASATSAQTKSINQLIDEIDNKNALKISQAIDYTNPTTRDYAVGLVKKSSHGNYNIAQVCDIWESGYNKWIYVNDPAGQDYYSPASRTINLGLKGDCDDFAILNAAIIESIGGSSRVVTACAPNGGSCHAYAEVYISNNYTDLQSTTDYLRDRYGTLSTHYHKYSKSIGIGTTEYWLNLDWNADHPGAEFFQDDGTYKIFYPGGSHDKILNSGDTLIWQVSDITFKTSAITPTPTIDWSELGKISLLPTPTPTIDWPFNLTTPTPTPTIEYDWAFKLKK